MIPLVASEPASQRRPITCSVRGSMSCHAGDREQGFLFSFLLIGASQWLWKFAAAPQRRQSGKCCAAAPLHVLFLLSASVKQEIALITRVIMCAACASSTDTLCVSAVADCWETLWLKAHSYFLLILLCHSHASDTAS